MKLDYAFLTAAAVDVATDMLIDAVSERRIDNADELGEIIHICRKINRLIPITTQEEQKYIEFCEFNFDTGVQLTCRKK